MSPSVASPARAAATPRKYTKPTKPRVTKRVPKTPVDRETELVQRGFEHVMALKREVGNQIAASPGSVDLIMELEFLGRVLQRIQSKRV